MIHRDDMVLKHDAAIEQPAPEAQDLAGQIAKDHA
jgi:hypothetical protein